MLQPYNQPILKHILRCISEFLLLLSIFSNRVYAIEGLTYPGLFEFGTPHPSSASLVTMMLSKWLLSQIECVINRLAGAGLPAPCYTHSVYYR